MKNWLFKIGGGGLLLLLAFVLLVPDVVSDGRMGIPVRVQVLDKHSGKPIAGARVVLKSKNERENPELRIVPKRAMSRSDVDGVANVTDSFPAGWDNFGGGVRLEGETLEVSCEGYERLIEPLSEAREVRWKFFKPTLERRVELERVVGAGPLRN